MKGGLVETLTIGSTREPEFVGGFDVNSNDGIKHVHREFAAKVADIQKEDECSYVEALQTAVNKHPELAAAYKAAVPR